MIRFRFVEDEKRYLGLIAEVYRLLATHLPAPAVQLAMRNLGKAQDMLMMDGVRQGLALAELSALTGTAGFTPDCRSLKAFQVHAMLYGSADTPLRDMEQEWLDKLGLEPSSGGQAWLDEKPMRFAPQTYRAWQAEQERPPNLPPPDEGIPTNNDDIQAHRAEDYESVGVPPPAPGLDQEDRQERPALLDEARDVLQNLVKSGYQPGSWSEMIMRLHLVMKVDAGFLDLQMGTEMGRTVLAQCGIHDILPGRGVNLQEMQSTLDSPEDVLSVDSTEP